MTPEGKPPFPSGKSYEISLNPIKPVFSHCFPMIVLWFSHGFPSAFPMSHHGFLLRFPQNPNELRCEALLRSQWKVRQAETSGGLDNRNEISRGSRSMGWRDLRENLHRKPARFSHEDHGIFRAFFSQQNQSIDWRFRMWWKSSRIVEFIYADESYVNIRTIDWFDLLGRMNGVIF